MNAGAPTESEVDCDTLSRNHIVLVGMMGVGKSTVGRMVAERMERPLFDSDHMIEAAQGQTVREIWLEQGEAAFRELETKVLTDALAENEPSVIAAAGGIVLSEANRSLLQGSQAHTVWLLGSVEVLLQRVKSGVHRPLLDDDPEGALTKMWNDREELYREVADAIVMVDHRSQHEVAQAVLRCTG